LLGATVGILPDLDIFIPQPNDIASMTDHRSWSHSWLVHTVLSPVLAVVIHRFDRTHSFKTIWLMVWLALVTHSALDALTVYGTQLFWPFMPSPASGGSIFIIDPLYSLSLLFAAIFIITRPAWQISQRVLYFSFVFSCLYLVWGLTMQTIINHKVNEQLHSSGIHYIHTQVSATAFNSLLWRVLVITDQYYYEGFRSILDKADSVTMTRFDRGTTLEDKLLHNPHYARMKWFTNERFKLSADDGDIVLTDLRMGKEPHYFFRFTIANEAGIPVEHPERVSAGFDRRAALKTLWHRIWHEPVH
jgi:inner membrane protein